MSFKKMHRLAMKHFSKAELLSKEGRDEDAFSYYNLAADLETEVAESYFEKAKSEPTRSILIRSAAFVNLKAGRVAEAQRFIYFGLLNLTDEVILNELKDALKLSLLLEHGNAIKLSSEYSYLKKLKEHSKIYRIEPEKSEFYGQVTTNMIVDFFSSIHDSYGSYLRAALTKIEQVNLQPKFIESIVKNQTDFRVLGNWQGSFEVELVNDFVPYGTSKEVNNVTINSLDIFTRDVLENPMDNEEITEIKKRYTQEEVNNIYGPIIKVRSSGSDFKIEVVSKDRTRRRPIAKLNKDVKKKVITKVSREPGNITSLISTTGALTEEGKKIHIPGFTFSPSEAMGSIIQLRSPNKKLTPLSEPIAIKLKQNAQDKYDLSSQLSPSIHFTNLENEQDLKEALITMELRHYYRVKFLLESDELNDKDVKELDTYKTIIGDVESL